MNSIQSRLQNKMCYRLLNYSMLFQIKLQKNFFIYKAKKFFLTISFKRNTTSKRNKNFDRKSKTKIESKDLIIILVCEFIENY
jgi:hypoxanthine-guanine phosphoribosyltransferase